jgi:predicted Rdx family selenoprotein
MTSRRHTSPTRQRPITPRLAGTGLLLTSLLAVTACSKTLDVTAVRDDIAAGLTGQLGLEVTTVQCPEGRAMRAGDVFECAAMPAIGGRLVVRVTQKDDQGQVGWEVARTEGLLDLEALAARVQDSLRTQADIEAAVDCGGTLRAAEPGKTFTCTATPGQGDPVTVTVTMNDAEGNVSWAVDPGQAGAAP